MLGMWLEWGDRHCIKNSGGELFWKAAVWKTDKEMEG